MRTGKNESVVEAFSYSLAVTNLLSVVLVIVKEKNDAVMALLKSMTSHHWITHGLIVVTFFALLGLLLERVLAARAQASDYNRSAAAILSSTIVSGLVLVGFYLFWA